MITLIKEAVSTYTANTGDAAVFAVELPVQDASLGYGADYHPVEANHEIAAKVLADAISEIMNWK